ncbi:uncharacterized protein FA14DRAFT_157465 [Meira miltonrushii]|uniref:Zn(2)-C6 fungal-type domain-containing protein n=1 Tax=Meira miltonrushii TaxID=1280837 RepID=A0A316V5C1_9BASI|nr:uncharacterized protein FA14DRAFT_157465 [Meira miltonrushii]PWN32767.1 hypothetical protein FA14DRAFT_157465 [Meira miltonrushii]
MTNEAETSKTKFKRIRAQLSCDRCRKIKRMCDRQNPCNRCLKDDIECVYDRALQIQAAAEEIKRGKRKASDEITPPANRSRLANNGINNGTSPTNPSRVCSCSGTDAYNSSWVWKFLEEPTFLHQVVDLYVKEADWIFELYNGSRLERLLKTCTDPINENALIWKQTKIFALAILAITAQMCPTETETILLFCEGLDAGEDKRNSGHIALAAYNECVRSIDEIGDSTPVASNWSLDHKMWNAEVFAASYLLRNVEKNNGQYRKQSEGVVLDLTRMQHAGMFRQGCRPCLLEQHWAPAGFSLTSQDWPKQHEVLSHNVFWAYYVLDRLANMLGGSAYYIQPAHTNICLNDVFGHTHIRKLNVIPNSAEQHEVLCSMGVSVTQPIMSAYSGAKCRFSAVCGHFIDRLAAMYTLNFSWPSDAERLVSDLERDMKIFDSYIIPMLDDPADRFAKAKQLTLSLCIEMLRTSFSLQMTTAFAATLYNQADVASKLSPAAREVIDWQLHRRRLEAAKTLILRVISYSRTVLGINANWPYFASSIREQALSTMEIVEQWIEKPILDKDVERSRRIVLLDSLQSAIKGRNFLVLIARKSELSLVHKFNEEVSNRCLDAIKKICNDQNALTDGLANSLADSNAIVDDHKLMKAIRKGVEKHAEVVSSVVPHSNPGLSDGSDNSSTNTSNTTPTGDSSSVEGAIIEPSFSWDNIFADLSTMEHLFNDYGIQIFQQQEDGNTVIL